MEHLTQGWDALVWLVWFLLTNFYFGVAVPLDGPLCSAWVDKSSPTGN